jgi:uncharacterized protein
MPNRLAQETSPYLQQHANNPVDWFAWGEAALTRAREENKPILLSVGYSACHWCHVMAHESFEDDDVAAQMNELFINIKVDREERPDIDQIYQTAHHMLTQRNGGWPLTMFLTPDGTPFFGGTYFPKMPRYGMPGFKDMLPRIAAAYHSKRNDIAKQNASLMEALSRTLPSPNTHEGDMQPAMVAQALREFEQMFDEENGGIGQAPKFPHPYELMFCLRRYAQDGAKMGLRIAQHTLTMMAEGGIYDHLGGAFARYSVDQTWTIPHFEKMLYDNGPLLALYSDTWLVTGAARFKNVARETAEWVVRDMQSQADASEGGYYSSLDADSEHEEGRFYVWTPDEAQSLLTPEEYAVLASHYGLDTAANFEDRCWHLRVTQQLDAVAANLSVDPATCIARLASARAKLLAVRAKRIWPGRDDKVLTSWNALMIKGMPRASRVFDEPAWHASARRALDFIRATLWQDGRLLATYKDGRAHLNAYLDDHAFLLDALMEMMQTEFYADDLVFARALADRLLDQFEDPVHGGFFFTSHDHEKLIHRAKPGHENATPSGNGIAAYALQRLGHLIGEPRYLAAAERALRLFYPALVRNPSAFVSLVTALEEWLAPPRVVVLRGAPDDMLPWQRALAQKFRPDMIVLALHTGLQGMPTVLDKPASSTDAGAIRVNAWVCQGVTCLPPISNIADLIQTLGSVNSGK